MRTRPDELGLNRAISGPMVPALVAAMVFLAALSMAAWAGTASLSSRWHAGAGSALTVQVPQPSSPLAKDNTQTRLDAVKALLKDTFGATSVTTVSEQDVITMLQPWLGDTKAIPLPAVLSIQMLGPKPDLGAIRIQLNTTAPGTLLDEHEPWMQGVVGLFDTLWTCALLILALVGAVAIAVIGVATRAGLTARREVIEILHGLGATDSYISRRFASRISVQAGVGGAIGVILATPILLQAARMAASLTGSKVALTHDILMLLPVHLWVGLVAIPIITCLIGLLTAQYTVRRWLRRLP